MVDLARLAGLEHEANLRAGAGPHEVVMYRRDGQEGRYRGLVGAMASVGQDDDVVTLGDRLGAAISQLLDGLAHAGPAIGNLVKDRKCDRPEAVRVAGGQVADLLQLFVGEDGRRQFELVGGARVRIEQVALRPDRHLSGGDYLLANGVDRRIRDLGEQLLEIRVEQLRPLGQDRKGGVVAHRPDRVGSGGGHRVDEDADVLGRVAEDFLAAEHGLVVRLDDARRRRQLGQLDQPLANPLLVGMLGGDAPLQLVVRDDPLLARVDEEHAPRLETALGDDLVGRDVENAGLRGHDDAAVGR